MSKIKNAILADFFKMKKASSADFIKKRLKQTYLKTELVLMGVDGPEIHPLRIPTFDEAVIIDAVNFVIAGTTFGDDFLNAKHALQQAESDNDRVAIAEIANRFCDFLGQKLAAIFGDDFAQVTYSGKKMHFYRYGCLIGTHDKVLGHVCFGGQKDTILFQISGTGCSFADSGWEYELYKWLKDFALKPKLTRIDMAHDDIQGAYLNVVDADIAETQKQFMLTNRRPSVQQFGDWKHHNGAGRTLQIGKRENGKLIRIYEKGKQLGDKNSPWCRAELEFGNKSRFLPLEMLISPTEYFIGAYPYTDILVQKAREHYGVKDLLIATRIETVKKTDEISFLKSVEVLKNQYGRYIKAYRALGFEDTQILNMIETDKKKDFFPKRLILSEKLSQNPPSYAREMDGFAFSGDKKGNCYVTTYENYRC